MNYKEAIGWLFSTQLFGIKLGLEAPKRLLKEFLAYPRYQTKVIHVAGTNGKGSVCAMIDSVARASGIRTGLFTSPHLINFGERIRVSSEEISKELSAKYISEIKELTAGWETHPTFFELTLAVAMRHFKERQCELIILETGMGGRLDATTAVPADVAVITPIALDHMQWLGDTLEAITLEKAGIIVPGKPTVSSPQKEEVVRVLRHEANEQRSDLTFINQPLIGYPVNILGPHQKENAAVALEALSVCGYELNFDTVKSGLESVTHPGRFELFENKEGLPSFVLDGAHNPHAAQSLVATWKERFPNQKASLIFGAVQSKDATQTLEIISEIAEEILLTPIDSPRTLTHQELKNLSASISPPVIVHKDLETALKNSNSPVTLVAGSLFLVGQMRSLLLDEAFEKSSQ